MGSSFRLSVSPKKLKQKAAKEGVPESEIGVSDSPRVKEIPVKSSSNDLSTPYGQVPQVQKTKPGIVDSTKSTPARAESPKPSSHYAAVPSVPKSKPPPRTLLLEFM